MQTITLPSSKYKVTFKDNISYEEYESIEDALLEGVENELENPEETNPNKKVKQVFNPGAFKAQRIRKILALVQNVESENGEQMDVKNAMNGLDMVDGALIVKKVNKIYNDLKKKLAEIEKE
ncbi:MAG: hypothetical protein E6R04_11885 [Spirochaetes bacterium]|nr:MAG: hypothetical protein E6R04_11885 [Spirochaetota bacterium]